MYLGDVLSVPHSQCAWCVRYAYAYGRGLLAMDYAELSLSDVEHDRTLHYPIGRIASLCHVVQYCTGCP